VTPSDQYAEAVKKWRSRLYLAELDALGKVLAEARAALDEVTTTVPRSEADLLALTQIAHEIARRLRETEQEIEKHLA
jgi:hypothetical protein